MLMKSLLVLSLVMVGVLLLPVITLFGQLFAIKVALLLGLF